MVIASGITYGEEEEDLTFLFQLAWKNEKCLPIFGDGKNFIPLLHVKDLSRLIYELLEKPPKRQYILAVEQTPSTLKQIVKALSKSMGFGKTKEIVQEEAFLYKDLNQTLYDCYTVNLNMEPVFIVEDIELEWQNELNLFENINGVVAAFRKARNLKPLKVILHGPPAAGKTRLAKQLCEYYGTRYLSIKSVIEDTILELQQNIADEKAKIKLKEEKAKKIEEEGGGDDIDDEGAEEEEEEEGYKIEEWEEQLRDNQGTMAESENGKLPDEYVIRLMNTAMSSNWCQNQGYILDGYPKTIKQANELFGQGGEAGEEEELDEEEGAGGAAGGSKVLPDFVISLEANDEFLCERIMSLAEKEIQGTHYTEENMLRRLEEFRTNNTEDNTVLNFFDEIEIHPKIINIMNDLTPDMEEVLHKILNDLGPAAGFGPTLEEQEEAERLEIERQKLIAKEAELNKELLEREAMEDHQKKMEEWANLLEQLQMEEEKVLVAEGEPLRNYLMKFVFPTLSKGLLEVARIKPNDPVDFLAEYLFKENPEGRMFDPAYTRDGEHLITECKNRLTPQENSSI